MVSNSTSDYKLKRTEISSQKHPHTHVHNSTVHSTQKVEVAQNDGLVCKMQNIHTKEILPRLKKENCHA